MRIPWIATTTIGLAGIAAADYLTFVPTAFGDSGQAAVIQSGNWGRPFNWTTSESLTVQSVTLYTMNSATNRSSELATASNQSPVAGPNASNADAMPAPIPASGDTSRLSMHIHNRQPDGPPGGPSSTSSSSPGATAAPTGASDAMTITNVDSTGGTVMINQISDFVDQSQLYFMASWTGSNSTSGQSYSRYFEICSPANCNQDENEAVYINAGAALPETILPGSPPVSTTTLPTEASSSIAPPRGPSPSSGSSSSSSKKSGLSTGAIAGIAVACGIVGLALIGVLFWFFFRRRRDTTGMSPLPYGHERNRTRELMAEKEGNGGTENAPHSPYSDDGPQPHGGSVGGSGGGVDVAAARYDPAYQHEDHHALERSFTPYSEHMGSVSPPSHMAPLVHADHDDAADLARHQESHSGDSESSGLRPQTPRALSTPYAHLIEEGMTEEEIRRIEEEERQLDAEIERAGRRD